MVHPNSDRVPRVPPYSGNVLEAPTFQLRDYHPLWWPFPRPSSRLKLCNSMDVHRNIPNTPPTPSMQRPAPWHIDGLGLSAFAHHYLRNRSYFLLLQVLRCFTSLRSPLQTIFSPADDQPSADRVSPFGYLRIIGCLHLSEAFRSLPRPSSPSAT